MKINIVGAGLAGSTAAAILSKKHSVEVFETRNHIGGNCYDGLINNILVQQYGGHIFHTFNEDAWKFVNRYATFNTHKHQVIANTRIGYLTIPVSKATMQQYNLTEADIVDLVFKDYSEKQWGKKFEELPSHIRNRTPIVRESEEDYFFLDRWQGIPTNGYTEMIQNMLDGVNVHLGVSPDEWQKRKCDLTIHTGMVDQAHGFVFGRLGYRSLTHDHRQENKRNFCVINECTHNVLHTRSYDNAHWQNVNVKSSIITYEYPRPYNEHEIPYYPLGNKEDLEIYKKYLAIGQRDILFLGRLGLYRYMNMDETINGAMKKVKTI